MITGVNPRAARPSRWKTASPSRTALPRALHHVLTRADLERGIAQLTDLQQQAITLRFIAGCSIAETAHVMQRSEQAVKDLQHKALIALRKSLE